MPYTKNGIYLPPRQERRPCGSRRRQHPFSVLMGIGAVINPDGTIESQDPEWMPNALANEGQTSIHNVYFGGGSNPSKYLGLINGGTVAPVVTSNMSYLGQASGQNESQVPAANGYNRQQVVNGVGGADWTDNGIIGGASKYTANQKTFGPFSATTTATHAFMCTAVTGQLAGSGKFILFIALSGNTVLNSGQSFAYLLSDSLT